MSWSSTRSDGSPALDRDLLLATLTLYWTTGTITSSLVPYWAARHDAAGALPVDDPSPVRTAVSTFGGERVPFPRPPKALAERYFTVSRWREYDSGGHFPAVAEPELLARILRELSSRTTRRRRPEHSCRDDVTCPAGKRLPPPRSGPEVGQHGEHAAIAALAVPVNIALVVAFGSLAWPTARTP